MTKGEIKIGDILITPQGNSAIVLEILFSNLENQSVYGLKFIYKQHPKLQETAQTKWFSLEQLKGWLLT